MKNTLPIENNWDDFVAYTKQHWLGAAALCIWMCMITLLVSVYFN